MEKQELLEKEEVQQFILNVMQKKKKKEEEEILECIFKELEMEDGAHLYSSLLKWYPSVMPTGQA
jgi:ribosomal protein S7